MPRATWMCALTLVTAAVCAQPDHALLRDYVFAHEKGPLRTMHVVQRRLAVGIDDGIPVSYTSGDKYTLALTRFEGAHVALLLSDRWLRALTREERWLLLDRADLLYVHYQEIVGQEPAGDGLLTIAITPSTCGGIGYGCGAVGAKWVEVVEDALDDTRSALATGHLPTVLLHEMAHNFDVYNRYLQYTSDGAHAWTRFLERYGAFYSRSGAYGVNLSYPNHDPRFYSPEGVLRIGIEENLGSYMRSEQATWDRCVRLPSCAEVNDSAVWGGVMNRLAQMAGPDVTRAALLFWRERSHTGVPPVTPEAKADLHIEAFSEAMHADFGCVADYFKWYASPALRERMKAKYQQPNPWCQDNDHDGSTPLQGDLDDNDASVHPGATEVVNGIDDDADGIVDDVAVSLSSSRDDIVDTSVPAHLSGVLTFDGVDGPGKQARFLFLRAIAVDAKGIVYAADQNSHTIRKIMPNGEVTTLAGAAGVWGAADGIGSAARFHSPQGLAVDNAGVVYVSDTGNHAIRRITPAGVVSTIAGKLGVKGFADGVDSLFSGPVGLTLDRNGDLIIIDRDNCLIRRLDNNGVVSSMAGTLRACGTVDGIPGRGQINGPIQIATAADGVLWFTEPNSHVIRTVARDGLLTTVAGVLHQPGYRDGPAGQALFAWPESITVDADGVVYVTDGPTQVIRRLTKDGQVDVFVGKPYTPGDTDGKIQSALVNTLRSIVAANGTLYFAQHSRLRSIKEGTVATIAGAYFALPGATVRITAAHEGPLTARVRTEPETSLCMVLDPGSPNTAACTDSYAEFFWQLQSGTHRLDLYGVSAGSYDVWLAAEGWRPTSVRVNLASSAPSETVFAIDASSLVVDPPANSRLVYFVSGLGWTGSIPFSRHANLSLTQPIPAGWYGIRVQVYADNHPFDDATPPTWFHGQE